MDPNVDSTDRGKPERTGRDILDRALAGDGAMTRDEATRLHRAIGWPPPVLDADGAIRPPTPDELARWQSTDPAILEALSWAAIGEEIEHRSPAIYAAALAAQRATVAALREHDRTQPDDSDTQDNHNETDARDDDDAPITGDELAAWDRVGRTLAAHPAALRRILAALSSIEPAHQPPSRRAP